jgi:hypothetical protein
MSRRIHGPHFCRPCGTREPFLDANQGLKPLAIVGPSLRDAAEVFAEQCLIHLIKCHYLFRVLRLGKPPALRWGEVIGSFPT